MKVKIIFLDCDGVLIFGKPWLKLHERMHISSELDRKWMSEYYGGQITFEQWNRNVEKFYRKNKLTLNIFKEVMALENYSLNNEARELVEYINDKKIVSFIISGGIDSYVSKVAKNFNIPNWIANYSVIFDSNGDFEKIKYVRDDELFKRTSIQQVCKQYNALPTETIFIGDSRNDIKAFDLTKHGILYRTKDRELGRTSWKRVNDLKEVISILESLP